MITAALLILAPIVVAADGQWAALSQGRTCEAAARSLGTVYKDRRRPVPACRSMRAARAMVSSRRG